MKDDYALVVGIDGYPRLRDLRGAGADAIAMYEWLVDPDGGDIPAQNVCLLTSEKYPPPAHVSAAQPKLQDLAQELDRLCILAGGQLKLGRRLYLFLSGHGVSKDIADAALLMADATEHLLLGFSGVEYAKEFRGSTVFEEVVLLMDCCRTHLDRRQDFPLLIQPIHTPGADADYFFGFATGASLETREHRDEGKKWRGDFTRALLEAISVPGATSTTIREFVPGRMAAIAHANGDAFHDPRFEGNSVLAFGAPAAAPAPSGARIAFPATDPAVIVRILDGAGHARATHPLDGGVWMVDLPFGLYELVRSDEPPPPPGEGRFFRVEHSGYTDVGL